MSPGDERSRPLAGTASEEGTGKHHNLTSGYRAEPTESRPGLERSIAVTRRDWWSRGAARAIDELVKGGRAFTAEDVVEIVGEPWEPNLLGAVLAGAQRQKRITVVSAIIGRDGKPRRVWGATS